MTTESLASYAEVLKILFEEDVVESLNDNIVLYRLLKQRGQVRPYGGREIRFTLRTVRQEGTGFVPNNAQSLPTPTVTDQIEPSFTLANFYGVGEIDDMLLEDSASSKFAYREGLEDIKDSLLMSFLQDSSAVLYGDGRGVMAELPAADNQSVVTVDYPNYMRDGKRTDVIDNTDNYTKLVDSAVISDVEYLASTSVITMDKTLAGSAQGDFFGIEDAIGPAGEQYCWHGLQSAVSASNPPLNNYGGLNRSSVSKRWQSQVDSNSGTNRAITERLILDNLGLQRRWSKTSLNDLIFLFNWDIGSQYWEELVQDRIVSIQGAEAQKLVGGYDGATNASGMEIGKFAGKIPMLADEMAPSNRWYGLNMKSFRLYQTHDPELVTKDGQVLHRLEQRPAYQFRYLWRAQLVLRDPRAQFVIEDVAHS